MHRGSAPLSKYLLTYLLYPAEPSLSQYIAADPLSPVYIAPLFCLCVCARVCVCVIRQSVGFYNLLDCFFLISLLTWTFIAFRRAAGFCAHSCLRPCAVPMQWDSCPRSSC